MAFLPSLAQTRLSRPDLDLCAVPAALRVIHLAVEKRSRPRSQSLKVSKPQKSQAAAPAAPFPQHTGVMSGPSATP